MIKILEVNYIDLLMRRFDGYYLLYEIIKNITMHILPNKNFDNDNEIKFYSNQDSYGFLMSLYRESFRLMSIDTMAVIRSIIVFDNTFLPSVTFAPKYNGLITNMNSKKMMESIKWMNDDEKESIKHENLMRKLAEETL